MRIMHKSLESPDLKRVSSNLSDLEIDINSQFSSNELLEDCKFDAGHVYRSFKKEMRDSNSINVVKEDISSSSKVSSDLESKKRNRNKSVEFSLHSYKSPIFFAKQLAFDKQEKKNLMKARERELNRSAGCNLEIRPVSRNESKLSDEMNNLLNSIKSGMSLPSQFS